MMLWELFRLSRVVNLYVSSPWTCRNCIFVGPKTLVKKPINLIKNLNKNLAKHLSKILVNNLAKNPYLH